MPTASRMRSGPGVTALALFLVCSFAAVAAATDKPKPKPKPRPAPAKAAPRSLPQEGERDENDHIRARDAWRWEALTYPRTTIPPEPLTRARDWVLRNVPAGTWAAPSAGTGLAGPDLAAPSAPVPPGVNAWTAMGPRPIDMATQSSGYRYGHVTGRFNAVAVDPRTTGSPGAITAYAGAASGGVWKTQNCCGAGTTWTSLWDTDVAVAHASSAIELDPVNPDIVYAGTGDGDANDQFSEGIMKSTDAGQNWTQLGASVFTPFAAGTPLWRNQNVTALRVDPNNRSTVLAGTRYELFVSHDGGTGWQRCPFGANPTDPTSASNPIRSINRVSGIVLDASTNPTTVYLAVGWYTTSYNGDNGVYKGTLPASGCPSLSLVANGWPAGTGNGVNGGSVGNIRLASSRGNASSNLVLYAQVQDTASNGALGTWVTTNGGSAWTQLSGSTDPNYKDCTGASTGEQQDWYDLFLLPDPQDDKTLYVGRTSLYKATVNATYTSMSITNLANVYGTSCPSYGSLHPDQHGAAWISGTGGTTQFLLGNDGGLYAANGTAGGFTALNDSVNATEWYAGQVGANYAGGGTQYLYGGSQDNGTASWDSSNAALTWQARSNGGDGFFSAFDPVAGTLSAGWWYSEYVYGQMSRSTTGAAGAFNAVSTPWYPFDNPGWSSPYRVDQFHCTDAVCRQMIFGAQHFWTSTNGATSWTQAGSTALVKTTGSSGGSIAGLDFALSDPKAVVVGTSDGNAWFAPNAFTGASCTQAAANTATFACTANGAPTWTNLTQSNAVLPNRSIFGVTFDPTTTNTVYAAVAGFNANTPSTPGHVFRATNSGGTWTWTDKTGNLPDVPAWSVLVNPNNAIQVFVGMANGFYYTDDITAQPPSWLRFQDGLPPTNVQFLAVDRGPSGSPYASTTLAAFTYGRGTYTIRLPGPGGFGSLSPVQPTMTGRKNANPALVDITYDATSCPAPNHDVFWGALGNYTAVTGSLCAVGASGTVTGVPIPNNAWWVVVATDQSGSKISAFGFDSSGNPESFTGWQGVCGATAQSTSATCPAP